MRIMVWSSDVSLPICTGRTTTSGVGDLSLATRYAFDTGSPLGVALGARAKLATADETHGLGTGANDYGVRVDLYRSIGYTVLFAGAGQDRPGASPRNQHASQPRPPVGFRPPPASRQCAQQFDTGTPSVPPPNRRLHS